MRKKNNEAGWIAGMFGVLALCASILSYAADPELTQAQALMKAGRPAEAYALLAPLEDKRAGDPNFDYLLGIAALDSGRADRATLAFERVLAVNPNFAGARLDMARAYFHLGDLSRARAEFETVLQQNPPQAARATIKTYLDAIAQRESAKKTALTGYVEFTAGRDDNVNNSTSQAQVAVPALGNLVFTLDPTNVKRADSYTLLSAGADIAHEIGPGLALFAGTTGRFRTNSSEDRFDYKSIDGRGGVAIAGQSTLLRLSVSGERYYLDHQSNRNSVGVGADLRYGFNPANFANLFVQHNRYRFESQELAVNNFDQTLLGVGWQRLFNEGRNVFVATVFVGKEDETNTRADGNKDIVGMRLGGQLNLRDKLDAFASIGRQKGDYDRENVAFQATRDDTLADAVIGFNWRFGDAWSLRPQVLRVRNDSNIVIYTYKRTDYSITLRRDFK